MATSDTFIPLPTKFKVNIKLFNNSVHCRPSNILGSAIKMYCKVLSIDVVTMTRYSPSFELGRVCPDQTHVTAPVLVVDKTAAEESSEFEAL